MQLTKSRAMLGMMAMIMALALVALLGAPVRAADAAWSTEFWNNKDLSGVPVFTRQDQTIDFNWGHGSPVPGVVNDDNFSARWKRRVAFNEGNYRFEATMDDAMRVYLDGQLIIDGWWDSQVHTLVKDVYVTAGDHDLQVDYYEAGGEAIARFNWTQIGGGSGGDTGGGTYYPNWKGQYFNNTSLSGAPVLVRDDRYLQFDWGAGSPAPGVVNNDYFSARWTHTYNGNPGHYRVFVTSDDGVRVWMNGQLVIDNWNIQGPTTSAANYSYTGGPLNVQVDYFENTQNASIKTGVLLLPGSGGIPPTTPPSSCQQPIGLNATVNTGRLNFRSGPSTSFPVVTTLSMCDTVPMTGFTDSTRTWVEANLPGGQKGWASSSYLLLGTPTSQLAVASTSNK